MEEINNPILSGIELSMLLDNIKHNSDLIEEIKIRNVKTAGEMYKEAKRQGFSDERAFEISEKAFQ